MSAEEPLSIEFCGEIRNVDVDHSLTIGRQAELFIDDNPHLHRVLGRFFFESGVWWFGNEGSSITVSIADLESRSSIVLAPGRESVLSFHRAALRFRAGTTDYELTLQVPLPDDPEAVNAVADTLIDDEDGVSTVGYDDLPLTDEQRLLLVGLAERTLRDPHRTIDLPANREIAVGLGWSVTKFNRKLDNLCYRFTKMGVGGLRGSVDRLASDRRRRLVEHVISSGIITVDDLKLLGDP